MSSRKKTLTRWTATAVMAGSMTVGMTACNETEAFSDRPERSAEALEMMWFDSPEDLSEASDLVVRGRVTEIGQGTTLHEGGRDEFTPRLVTLQVMETLKGEEPVGSTVVVHSDGWDEAGVGYVVNGREWDRLGDEGYYFLMAGDDGTYGFRSSYGRVLIAGKQAGPSGEDPDEHGPWAGLATALADPESVRSVVRQAVRSTRSGGQGS